MISGLFVVALALASSQISFEQLLASAEDSFNRGDLARAERSLLAAEKLNPKSFLVDNNLGTLYLRQHRYPAAIKEFSGAAILIRIVPT